MGIAEELRWTAVKLMKVGKFAVDSAVTESLKGGLQVYAIVKGKLKGQPPSSSSDFSSGAKKLNFGVAEEEMQAKLEKMQQHMNDIQQQSRRQEQEHLKHLFEEPLKSTLPEVTTGPRKIFIHSRL